MGKSYIILNKPIYVGSAVLDLSKLWMYQYWYDYIKPEYGEKVNLLYTDTDSLVYEVETADIYADMAKNADLFDFSNYPKDHQLFNTENKAVIGKFKDECGGIPMCEFIGLRAKMYAFEIENGEVTKKAKGVSKNVVKNELTMASYRDCLFNKKVTHTDNIYGLRVENHKIYLTKSTKKVLCPLDTKRWLFDDGINSYAYGHYKIQDTINEKNALAFLELLVLASS
jgi:hypothetical protein